MLDFQVDQHFIVRVVINVIIICVDWTHCTTWSCKPMSTKIIQVLEDKGNSNGFLWDQDWTCKHSYTLVV